MIPTFETVTNSLKGIEPVVAFQPLNRLNFLFLYLFFCSVLLLFSSLSLVDSSSSSSSPSSTSSSVRPSSVVSVSSSSAVSVISSSTVSVISSSAVSVVSSSAVSVTSLSPALVLAGTVTLTYQQRRRQNGPRHLRLYWVTRVASVVEEVEGVTVVEIVVGGRVGDCSCF
jgi:hypothetical protein